MGKEERILKANRGRGRATLRELTGGKSAPQICSGLILRPFPPDLPQHHLKTQLLRIEPDREWVFNEC